MNKLFYVLLIFVLFLNSCSDDTNDESNPKEDKYLISIKEAFNMITPDIDSDLKLISISNLGYYSQEFIQQYNDTTVDVQLNGITRNADARTFIFEYIDPYNIILDSNGNKLITFTSFVVRSDKKTKIMYNINDTVIKAIPDSCINNFENVCLKVFQKVDQTPDLVTFKTYIDDKGFRWEFSFYDFKKGTVNILRANENGEIDPDVTTEKPNDPNI